MTVTLNVPVRLAPDAKWSASAFVVIACVVPPAPPVLSVFQLNEKPSQVPAAVVPVVSALGLCQ